MPKTRVDKAYKKKSVVERDDVKYHDEMPGFLILHYKDGRTKVEFCADHEIVTDTFDHWCDKHPEFAEAHKRGKILAEAFWINLYRKNIMNKDFNEGLFKHYMGGRFGHRNGKTPKLKGFGQGGFTALKALLDVCEKGKIDPKDLSALSNVLLAEVEIKDRTEMWQRIKQLEKQAQDRENETELGDN